jgi:hypothetical protein
MHQLDDDPLVEDKSLLRFALISDEAEIGRAIAGAAADAARRLPAGMGAACGSFVDVLGEDARRAQAAVGLALACRSIGSQIVDDLNASIHLRALLTDLFVVDEVLRHTLPEASL